MKAVTSLLLTLALVCAVVISAQAQGEKGKAKTVTLKGELQCTKCSLMETKACGNALVVKEGGKSVTYYLIDNAKKASYHGKICGGPKAATVTGVVSTKKDKRYIKPAKDGVKFD